MEKQTKWSVYRSHLLRWATISSKISYREVKPMPLREWLSAPMDRVATHGAAEFKGRQGAHGIRRINHGITDW